MKKVSEESINAELKQLRSINVELRDKLEMSDSVIKELTEKLEAAELKHSTFYRRKLRRILDMVESEGE